MNNGKKIHIPGGVQVPPRQLTKEQVLNALVHFMNEQMQLNKNIRHNLAVIEGYLIMPKYVADNASHFTCVSAIM